MKANEIKREEYKSTLITKNLPFNLTGFLSKNEEGNYYFSLYGIDFEIIKTIVETKEIAQYMIIGVITTMNTIKYNIGLY